MFSPMWPSGKVWTQKWSLVLQKSNQITWLCSTNWPHMPSGMRIKIDKCWRKQHIDTLVNNGGLSWSHYLVYCICAISNLKKTEHVIGKGNAACMHFNEYLCVLCEFPVNSICPSDSGIV